MNLRKTHTAQRRIVGVLACVAGLVWGSVSFGADAPPKPLPPAPIQLSAKVKTEIQNALACTRDPSTECSVKLGDSGSPFGMTERGFALMTKMSRTPADFSQASKDFRAAAKLDYPPAFEALAIFAERLDLDLSIAFRMKAAELGQAEAASDLLSKPNQRPGVENVAPIDKAFFAQLACHPAAFNGHNRLMVGLKDALEADAKKDFDEVVKRMRDASAQEFADQAAHYLSSCAKATYYIDQIPAPDRAAARDLIRARMVATLERIKVAAKKFPELQLFSRQEYQTLLPQN